MEQNKSILISGDYAWSFINDIEYTNGYADRSQYMENVRYSGIGGEAGLLASILSGEGWQVYAQATLDETHWSDMVERELRRRGVDTRFVERIPAGGGAVNIEENCLDRHGAPKSTSYSRGTWSKYARHRPLTAREEVPALLSKLDFVPDYYAFNSPEAGYRTLARELKAKGSKIIYFGLNDSGFSQSALDEVRELTDKWLTSNPFKNATLLGCKEFRDEDWNAFFSKELPNLPFVRKSKPHKLIYVHGSNSSGDSRTSHLLRMALPDWEVMAPDCPVDPYECLEMLSSLVESEHPDIVIGSSMGGLYVHQMRGIKRICINPAFRMSEDEDLALGNHVNRNTARKNGRKHYFVTPELLYRFHRMEEEQFCGIDEEDLSLCTGLFGLHDTVCPYSREEFEDHYGTSNVHAYDGEHSIDKENVTNVLVPLIKRLAGL